MSIAELSEHGLLCQFYNSNKSSNQITIVHLVEFVVLSILDLTSIRIFILQSLIRIACSFISVDLFILLSHLS